MVPMRQNLTSTEDGRVWTIVVSGDADLTLEPDLQAHFDAALDRGYRAIVLDLARTEFLDSNFMHAIWRFIRRIHAAGGDLAIACPSGSVRRSLEIFGVASRVNIYDDPREAATAL